MAKSYKPNRDVTSEKIRLEIERLFNERHKNKVEDRIWAPANLWKRKFKRRLPESRGWVRGFEAEGIGPGSRRHSYYAIALSDETDTKLLSVQLCDDADEECKKLGVLEIMFNE